MQKRVRLSINQILLEGLPVKSIQTKLTVTILIIFFVALVALGGLNYWKARAIISEDLGTNMQKFAVSSSEQVGGWLEARKS